MRLFIALLLLTSSVFSVLSAEHDAPESIAVISAHPLWGGRNVYIHKDGSLWTQVVAPPRKNESGLQEKVYKTEIDPTAWDGLLKVIEEHNFSTMKNSERPGVPDEARTTVMLGLGQGKSKSVWKWESDKDRGFNTLRDAIVRMGKSAEKLKPVLEGPFNYRWRPPGFPGGEGGAGTQFAEIPKNYDTIVVGKVSKVRLRNADVEDRRKYAVVMTVTEQLQGEPFPNGSFSVFIHSPSQEFGAYDKLEELNGRECIYALKREGANIIEVKQPFLFHEFKPDDLALLRRAVLANKGATDTKAPKVAEPEDGGMAKLSEADRETLWKMLSSTKDSERRKALDAIRPQLKEGMRVDEALKLFPADFFTKTPQDDGKVRYEAYIGGTTDLIYFRMYGSALGELIKFGYSGG